MGQRAERAMGRGVAVAAHDGGAGQGEALLRADHVDDALALVELVIIVDAEILGVLGERGDLRRGIRIVDALGTVRGRHVVVDDGERLLGRAHFAAGHAQTLEGLRARDLVDEMAVDIDEAGSVGSLVDQMFVPDLVVKRAGFGHLRVLSLSDRHASDSD
ncbi:MAG: hypothetical protein A49_14440 [Methyloceanibacter sp.]|nr:MAG: hypothetical protein A49_14440 [Methyloceanibacter sp.]